MSSASPLFPSAQEISEAEALQSLLKNCGIDRSLRDRIHSRAIELVERIRGEADTGLMELFLAEYGLSSDEGVALMCLAEALLRVPDGDTMDALIEDKIAPSAWGKHLGQSHSSLINASTWALYLTGKVLKETDQTTIGGTLHTAIKRLGEPVIREAARRAMQEMGRQFVLGETIEEAVERAREKRDQGFTYSYDMLGEAAWTEKDASRYHIAYSDAISELAKSAASDDIRENPGISIKLSALHPRYETIKRNRVIDELVPRTLSLVSLAKSAGIGLNIDAEEAGRLELSLDVIENVLSDPSLKGWDWFGIVVQAYNTRASFVIDRLYKLAQKLDRRIMVRLVKGAYWDTEIKHAQVEGLDQFPVFTRKASTDVSYICCAKKLLGMTDRIYPQFATHNAHSVASILEMAEDPDSFEFQRLHGMGEALHDTVVRRQKTRCRIYAPVGAHRDLLAYLVRRLLENGANSSFVNQIVDEEVAPAIVAADPFSAVEDNLENPESQNIRQPSDLFEPERNNSRGWDLTDPFTLEALKDEIGFFDQHRWENSGNTGETVKVKNPATGKEIGSVSYCSAGDVTAACERIRAWGGISSNERANILRKAADLYETNYAEIFALLMQEAGKTINDCIGELREALDFLRYYAAQGQVFDAEPAGVFTCISPWNFPLAIFTGQISAALAVGNGVLAKPAETTCLVADKAVQILHEAGVPEDVLILLPGTGAVVGSELTSNTRTDGVCFTGSTTTAQIINKSMAYNLAPEAPLIAETGGLNAMIVDSTALPEQAVRDVLASAFQSAGQRCSALRILYIQEDIKDNFLELLFGAMDELEVGNPQNFSSDVGPIIDASAAKKIQEYIDEAEQNGRLLKQLPVPDSGHFVGPAAIEVSGIEEMAEEIFGPVLHIAGFVSSDIGEVIKAINLKGYGLTFGLHTRIDDRVQYVVDRIEAGNIYINRNQIGAIVGSQPFGGEGLSGTGPKAGGPRYLYRFAKPTTISNPKSEGKVMNTTDVERAFALQTEVTLDDHPHRLLPGPTGESNQYFTVPRRRVLCLGPTATYALEQAERAKRLGCHAISMAPGISVGLDGTIQPGTLTEIGELDAVVTWEEDPVELRKALASRPGAIVPLLTMTDFEQWLVSERHICIDTTAAGGNAQLLDG